MGNGQTFAHYTKELASKQYEPLSIIEERRLLKEYTETGSQFAFDCLVRSHLRFVVYLLRHYKIPPTVDIMDVIQEANVGLIEGLKKFKPLLYNVRVYTYCVYWVKFYITKCLSAHLRIHKIFIPTSWDESSDDGPAEDVSEVSEYHEQIASDIVEHSLGGLPEREKAILVLFFGLKPPYTPKTLQEIGSMLHMHVERVRQLKEAALEKLKKPELQKLL